MQTRKNDNAFTSFDSEGCTHWDGLSKKEYFAGRALQGLVSNHVVTGKCTKGEIATAAVQFAEQLIIALNESESGVNNETIS